MAWDQAETWHYEANGFRPIAKEHNGKLFYIVTDHLGTPREMLDEAGMAVWRAKFSVWGELLDTEASNDPDYGQQSCNLRFQGQQYDSETGLHYNRYRYYDPNSAQYLSPDPIGLAGGLTPQAYVHDPNGWVDPLGLTSCPIGFAQGTAHTAFTPNRLQHASRHLTDAGILPNWNKATGKKFTELGTSILENPTATFDHVLGGKRVKGFMGKVGDKNVAMMVFKEGPYQGQIATSVTPSLTQMQNWGLSP